MNAKKELLDIITAKNLTILKIEIDYDAEGLFCSHDDSEDNINHITSIDDLDFDELHQHTYKKYFALHLEGKNHQTHHHHYYKLIDLIIPTSLNE